MVARRQPVDSGEAPADPRCDECGRSIVGRFGDRVWHLCASCEDDIARCEEAAFWGADVA